MSLKDRMTEIAQLAAERYAENTYVRAAVQVIPHAGGPLDTLLAGAGAKLVAERQMTLIAQLKAEMGALREDAADKDYLESEDFLHLLMKALSHAAKTSRSERIQLLARALASAAVHGWGNARAEDSESLLDLAALLSIDDLSHLDQLVQLGNRIKQIRAEKPEHINELQGYKQAGGEELIKMVPDRVLLRLVVRGLVREITGTYLSYGGGAYVPTVLAYDLVAFLGAVAEANREAAPSEGDPQGP